MEIKTREIKYDDDFAILFYKGQKVASGLFETFKDNWIEEAGYFINDLERFFDDMCVETIQLDEEDKRADWEYIWEQLSWCEDSKTYKYDKWELVILDI